MVEEEFQLFEENDDLKEDITDLEVIDESSEKADLDPFTSLMFGHRREKFSTDRFQPFPEWNQQQNQAPMINYQELMIHIDTLWTSVQELKPLFNKVYPFVKKFLEKK